jgi:hypothetical protein
MNIISSFIFYCTSRSRYQMMKMMEMWKKKIWKNMIRCFMSAYPSSKRMSKKKVEFFTLILAKLNFSGFSIWCKLILWLILDKLAARFPKCFKFLHSGFWFFIEIILYQILYFYYKIKKDANLLRFLLGFHVLGHFWVFSILWLEKDEGDL